MDDQRWSDEERMFTGPEGAERGEDEDDPIAAPEEAAAVEEDDVTGEGLRGSGRLEDRLEQEQPDTDRPTTAAIEEPEDVEHRRRAERREGGRLVDEGAVDREKDQVSEEAGEVASSRSAEEDAVRVEGDAPGGTEGDDDGGRDRYVEEP